MKKQIFLVLLLAVLCLLLGSCELYIDGKRFDEDFLESVSLQDLPLPTCEHYALNTLVAGEETMRLEIDLQNFEAYINSFVAYMNARDDIYYFGMQEGEGLLGEMISHRVAYAIEGDFEWESGINWYSFAYSLTDELGKAGACSTHKQYTDPIIVKFEYDAEKGMAYVNISKNGTLASRCIDEALVPPALADDGSGAQIAGQFAWLRSWVTCSNKKGLRIA